MGTDLQETLNDQDAILMGRKNYHEWSQFWPNNAEDSFANYINNIPKYVVSSTLKKVEWGKFDSITLFNNFEGVKYLKSFPGKNIGMLVSTTLVLSLIKENLIDELYLMIHPVIVGHEYKLFPDNLNSKKFKLIYSKTTKSGVIIAKYKIEFD